MEILIISCVVVNSVLVGLMAAMLYIHRMHKAEVVASLQELAKIKTDFTDTVQKASEANNSWARQILALEDRITAHEFIIKGKK